MSGTVTDFDFDLGVVYIGVRFVGIRKSTDFGASFTTLAGFNTLVPPDSASDIRLAIAPSEPSRLYSVVARGNLTFRVLRSNNSGTSWMNISPLKPNLTILDFHYGQGLYNNAIAVSPLNPDLVLAAGGGIMRTSDGGTSWSGIDAISDSYHADVHRIRWRSDGYDVIVATDGGWSRSFDGGLTWLGNQNTLPITQFYSIDGGVLDNSLVMVGGSQDNAISITLNSGFSFYPGAWNYHLPGIGGGDGGQVELDERYPQGMFAHVWANGHGLHRTANGGAFWTPVASSPNDNKNPNFYPLHDDRKGTLYVGVDSSVRKHTNFGSASTRLGAAILTPEVSKVKSAVSYPNSQGAVYAVTASPNTRNIWVYEANIGAWQRRFFGLPNVFYSNVATHTVDQNVAFAMVGDMTEPNKLFQTTNRGISWLNMTGDLIDIGGQGLMVTDVVAHPLNRSIVFIGTQFGCWRTTNGGTNWHRWNNKMPLANEIIQMRLIHNPSTNKYYVLAGSHGRGAWIREITGNDPATGTAYARFSVRMQGAWNTSTQTMNRGLNDGGELLSHFGTQVAIPAEAVDSINLEIRDSVSADASGIRNFRPAWLLTDGSIRDFNDTTKDYIEFDDTSGFYYLVVRHRNHIEVMSATPQWLDENSQPDAYDFTLSQSQAYGTEPMVKLDGSSFYGLFAGDADGDGVVSTTDVAAIGIDDGMSGYLNTDIDLSGTVSNVDIDLYTNPNLGRSTHVPGAPFRTYAVNDRWNLVSLPLIVADQSTTALFPMTLSPAFAYDPFAGYQIKDTLEYGAGYWLKFSSASAVNIEGTGLSTLTIPVTEGWNLIGSISDPLDVTAITSEPTGIVTSQFFGYNGSYFDATTIEPRQAYWVKVSVAGSLTLASSGVAHPTNRIRIVPSSELPPAPPDVEGAPLTSNIPQRFGLEQNYPNPFNPGTVIRYALPSAAVVTLKVYDVTGREVATLLERAEQDAGHRSVTFDASGLASGLYYYKLTAGAFAEVKKMVLVK